MSNTGQIEPPPPQRGMVCFSKGCLILVVFFIVLGIAFVGGSYLAVRYLRREYFPTKHVQLSTIMATEQEQRTVRARWDAFEKTARAAEPARIELTAEDLNVLIESETKLRGEWYVFLENTDCYLVLYITSAGATW